MRNSIILGIYENSIFVITFICIYFAYTSICDIIDKAFTYVPTFFFYKFKTSNNEASLQILT